jgi:protein-S-isoprenylcysteine O-methyltransferase Ste14
MRSLRGPVIGSLLWLVVAPGAITVLFPWLLSNWEVRPAFFGGPAFRWLGWLLILLGLSVLLDAFVRFTLYGRGTPAPYMLTERLVITGSYRHVRNPMYIAIVSIVVGEAVILGQRVLLLYAFVLWMSFQIFVLSYEEPSLRRRYGEQYDKYCTAVRRWWPRVRPWSGGMRTS